MTKNILMKTFFALACLSSTHAGAADDVTLDAILQQDGPYIDIPAGYVVPSGPPSLEDIVKMADLDGDPATMTEQEAEMFTVLVQVLIGTPVTQ